MSSAASGGELLTTVASGLLMSLGESPLALDTARRLLGEAELDVEGARSRLQEIVEGDGSCGACGESLADGSCGNCGAVSEADTAADTPVIDALKKPRKRRRRRKAKVANELDEYAVVNGTAQPWGGATPPVAAQQAEAVPIAHAPPNLRESVDWESCGNCVFYGKGQCNLYGLGRSGSRPDIVHTGGWPVDEGDLCDSHSTLTPRSARLDEARAALKEAIASGDGDAIVRARARAGKLEEFFGIRAPWNEAKHPRRGGKFSPSLKAVSKLGPGQRHNISLGVNIENDQQHGYSVLHHGEVLSRHGKDAVGAVNEAHRVAQRDESRRAMPVGKRRARRAAQLGLAHADGGAARIRPQLEEVKSDAYPGLDRSPKENWVDKAGGLPRYIERIAKHLHYEKGKPIGTAIAIAVNVVKRMCASGDTNFPGKQSVNPKSRAEACAAVADWEKKKGSAAAKRAGKELSHSDGFDGLDFGSALALYEADFKPIPPSMNFVRRLHDEIARKDGPQWMIGYALLDEADELQAANPDAEVFYVVEEARLDIRAPKLSPGKWSPLKHPRTAKGRKGGGEFASVLGGLAKAASHRRGGGRANLPSGHHPQGRMTPINKVTSMRPDGTTFHHDPGFGIPKRGVLERLSAPELAGLHEKVFGGKRPADRFIGRSGEMAMIEKLDRARPFKATHEYHPGVMDLTDPNVIEGGPIKVGSPVRIVSRKIDPLGKLAHVEDEHGNRQSVWRAALLKPSEVGRHNPPTTADHIPFIDQMNGKKGVTVAPNQPHLPGMVIPEARPPLRGRLNQPTGGAGGELAIDHAIGSVLQSHGDQLKDWHVAGPKPVNGEKTWVLTVELKDGGKHTINVSENGEVTDATKGTKSPMAATADNMAAAFHDGAAPKPHAAHAAATEKNLEVLLGGSLEPTGETEKPFHMPNGTYYRGKDGLIYQKLENTQMMGKKGPLAAVRIRNHTHGTEKTAPAFALQTYYDVLGPAGAAPAKPTPGGEETGDVFELLKKSVSASGNGDGSVGSLSGKNVVVTGKIPGHTREQFHAKLAAAGAHPQSSVTKTTDYLITGENVGKTKTNAASAKGVKVVPHHSILHLLEAKPSTEDRLAAVRIALSEAVGAGETVRLRARERVLVGRLGG